MHVVISYDLSSSEVQRIPIASKQLLLVTLSLALIFLLIRNQSIKYIYINTNIYIYIHINNKLFATFSL